MSMFTSTVEMKANKIMKGTFWEIYNYKPNSTGILLFGKADLKKISACSGIVCVSSFWGVFFLRMIIPSALILIIIQFLNEGELLNFHIKRGKPHTRIWNWKILLYLKLEIVYLQYILEQLRIIESNSVISWENMYLNICWL